MKHLIRMFVRLLVPAFVLAGVTMNLAVAQDKAKAEKGKAMQAVAQDEAKAEKGKALTKVLHEDDKVRVTETTYKPGDVGGNMVRGFRVSRVLSGGTVERTYADGKKEKFERKTGEVRAAGPDKQAYFTKNIGKTDYVTYTVNIKGAK